MPEHTSSTPAADSSISSAAAPSTAAPEPLPLPGDPVHGEVQSESRSLKAKLVNGASFGLSAVLSPYLVLPIGTAVIIGSLAATRREWFLYAAISVFFSTVVPALFVVAQVKRGKITDVHIMDRSQRGAPFWVAIGSSALGALVLRAMHAPLNIWSISAVLALNGMILTWITSFWKISMHVAVLTATVTAALMVMPEVQAPPLLVLVPALMWARVTRGRHTLWQGLAGASLSAFITGLCFFSLRYFSPRPASAPPAPHLKGKRP